MDKSPRPRILYLSPFFAPLANAEAFCGSKVALHLLEAGVDLTVLDVDYTGHPKFSVDPSTLWQPLERVTTSIPPHGGLPKFLSIPLGFRYGTPEWSRWIHTAVATARRIHQERPFDVIYSRSLPNVAHLAAYWVARAIRRPWVANFNDPWDLEGAHLLPEDREKRKRTVALRISEFWLRRVMHTADILTFPCARLRDYHLRLAQPRGECVVLPHIGSNAPGETISEQFQLMHAGNLGAGESTRRNTTIELLKAFRSFLDRSPGAQKNCKLVLVGPEDHPTLSLAQELGLSAYVSCTGRLSYHASLQRIASATVCLLVEGNMAEGIFLPSKFPDYLQAGKPVIALSPSIGTIADLASQQGVTQVSVANPAAIEAAIARHYNAFAGGQLASLEPSRELTQQYDGARVSQQLVKLFLGLTSRATV